MGTADSGNWLRSAGAYRASRRRFVGSMGVAVAAAGLVACSSSNNKNSNANAARPSASATAAAQATAAASGTRAGSPAASAAAGRTSTPAAGAIDPTKGRAGGTFKFQSTSYQVSLLLTQSRDSIAAKLAGLVHSGLLSYRNGRPGVDGTDISVEPDLAQALPEQPDPLTYVVKIKPNAKFHNGRTVVADDVAYSYNRYASGDKSAFKSNWTWFDTATAPDAQTVMVKTKAPFADAIQSLAIYTDAFILAKEFEESPDAANKLMGCGPYIWSDTQAPVTTTLKKNPDYFNKPYPYFDQIVAVSSTDAAKRIADFNSKQLQMTWWNSEEVRDQIKQQRPDATLWTWQGAGYGIFMRTDKPPFNDKRVRQALSMGIDRKAVRDSVSKGEGEPDQVFSIINKAWGFRKPAQLGDSAKYWNYDPQAAKQLMTAAGVTQPIDNTWTHWDAAASGQATVDMATLIEAQWKQEGLANLKDITMTGGQFVTQVSTGNYDGIAHGPNLQNIVYGLNVFNTYHAPADGVKPPTSNAGYVNDPQLNPLLEKQLTQFNMQERQQTFHQMEDIMADQQYRIILSTYTQNWFTDPSLVDAQVPIFAYSGSSDYFKYWWFKA